MWLERKTPESLYSGKDEMITVHTKHGTFTYKTWVWDIAWFIVGLCGFISGLCTALIL